MRANTEIIKVVHCLICLIVASALFCLTASIEAEAAGPGDQMSIVKVDLQRYGISWERNFPSILLTDGGQHICVWWEFGEIRPDTRLRFLVFNSAGQMVCCWSDTNSLGFLHEFPAVELRWSQRDFFQPPARRSVEAVTFDSDLTRGCRILVSLLPGSQGAALGPGLSPLYTIEMWRLTEPKQLLWSTLLPTEGETCARHPRPIDSLPPWSNCPLFLDLNGQWCAQIDPQNGHIIRAFEFGPIASPNDLDRHGHSLTHSNRVLAEFRAGSLSFDPRRHLIACGCSEDSRLRVIDERNPTRILFEAQTDGAREQRASYWSVPRVEFLADGRYLCVETKFEKRLGPYRRLTKIFDSQSWQVVWESNDPKINSFELSPDGRTMAYLLKSTLVVGSFGPGGSEEDKSTKKP